VALSRLTRKGVIRRVLRGIYDYPKHSGLLGQRLSPDLDQVSHALARKLGWRIQPSGAAALNLLGLSSQVPARILYLSDGPSRSYSVGNIELSFRNTALKEAGFRIRESAFLVQAIKELGADHIDHQVVRKLRDWLPAELREKVLRDSSTVTVWVYAALQRICQEENHG